MILPLLLTALLAAKPAPPPPPTKEERAKQVALKVLKRMPKVVWQEKLETGDLNADGKADTVALGLNGEEVVIAVLYAPVTPATVPTLLRFQKPKGKVALPGDVCGDPKELTLSLEPPGVKPNDLLCAGAAMTPECKRTLAAERRLQKARDHGGRGIRLSGGKCLPLHIYFDLGRAGWWRND
jgi:hypothetical protein